MTVRKPFVAIKKTLLHQDLLAELESAILHANLKPGERLVEADLAEEFGVSRGPIREALQDLERRGVVVRIPNRGTFVRTWSEKEIRDFYLFRAHVEGLSVRLAAERRSLEDLRELKRILDVMKRCLEERDVHGFLDADTQHHVLFARIADCSPLLTVVEEMRWRTRILMAWAKLTYGEPGQFQEAIGYHERILAAITGGDADCAEREMRDHLLNSSRRMLTYWTDQEAEPVL